MILVFWERWKHGCLSTVLLPRFKSFKTKITLSSLIRDPVAETQYSPVVVPPEAPEACSRQLSDCSSKASGRVGGQPNFFLPPVLR